MNLSDPSGDEDSNSDGSLVPAKRFRSDTYGASSTTSQGSGAPDSEDESPAQPILRQNNDRLSRSSYSENCSSPNDQYDEVRRGFEDDSFQEESSMHPSLGHETTNSFYNKSALLNETDNTYSAKSKRMMSKMGYKSGKGLGKDEGGRVEPIEASTQKGRSGLGAKPSAVGQAPKDFKWSPDEEKIEAKEYPIWLDCTHDEPLSGDLLEKWLQKGPKKLTIEDETLFVEPDILKGVLDAKTMFDTLNDEDLRHARFRSNPYETIGSVIFLNRAAVKMANIDAVFNFMFTQFNNYTPDEKKQEILYFADCCAGPGGFSEYVLWKKGWKAKGFGFTLKGPCDFKLGEFHAGTTETFDPYYGIKDNGDIFDPENLSSLKHYVLKQTNDVGVHFLMADGGFSVEGRENIQEILSKQLYLCQCLAALMLVRTGGHFVVKLFDIFTPFSVGLIYIMYRCFDKVCIHKPVTSRPANSERYLICKRKKRGTESAENHLSNVNCILFDGLEDDDDVTELVPFEVMKEDKKFFDYIYKSNCTLGEKQKMSLWKIAAFSQDKDLKEPNQATMREQCLKLWHLPDEVRKKPSAFTADDTLQLVLSAAHVISNLHDIKINKLSKPPAIIEHPPDMEIFKNVYDWSFMFLNSVKNSQDLRILLGAGGKRVYRLKGSEWEPADLNITLPAKTLIFAEVVKEYVGQSSGQMHRKALHIIDGLVLGGVDISRLMLAERIKQCDLFCTALNKPQETMALPIRCKRLFDMDQFSTAMNNLEIRDVKSFGKAVTIDVPNRMNRNEMFYRVGSILFMKIITEPWVAKRSSKTKHKYYFNCRTGASEYFPTGKYDAWLDMLGAYTSRVQWPWDAAGKAILENNVSRFISRAAMEEFIFRQIKV
ncbi:hypothetical protein ACJJTC_015974 [Scirpophaga incertulas]